MLPSTLKNWQNNTISTAATRGNEQSMVASIMAALFIGPRKHGQLLSAAGKLVNTVQTSPRVSHLAKLHTQRFYCFDPHKWIYSRNQIIDDGEHAISEWNCVVWRLDWRREEVCGQGSTLESAESGATGLVCRQLLHLYGCAGWR